MIQRITTEDIHEMVDALAAALDAKNSYTCGHSERVADIALKLAQHMGLPASEQQRIHIGAHLHDIGKIGIPDEILNKPGKLSDSEYAIMKQHPEIGSRIVRKVKVFQSVADIVRHHHERYQKNKPAREHPPAGYYFNPETLQTLLPHPDQRPFRTD